MNQKDRWTATLHFEEVDHVPDMEFGFWDETLIAWHDQGLPRCINDRDKALACFGLDTWCFTPFNVGLSPAFEYSVVEEDESHKIVIDTDGVKKMINKNCAESIPKYIKFPIENRDDWNEFKKRLDPTTPGRLPVGKDWDEWKADFEASERPISLFAGSLFGVIRDWMGFENVSYAMMDTPDLIEDIMEHLTELTLSVLEKPLRETKFHTAHMWEDMCFNHGPILPPRLFEKWMLPRLKRITSKLSENGCDVVWVDCDGNIKELLPLWMDAGVNCFFPAEVVGGSDIAVLREKYGRRIRVVGGVDKTRLIAGKSEIEKEIQRLKPLVEEGGYIPTLDHFCPPDITLENFTYYLQLKREAFGIPEPEPWKKCMD